MATSRGMDVSVYQAAQDWPALKTKGLTFAFAKASEGQKGRDAKFDQHISGILKAGLVGGAYHFGWPTQDVQLEAANYIAAVRPYKNARLVHWLDLERYSDGRNYGTRTGAQIRTWAAEWLRLVSAAFPGQRVGVYTSASDIAAGHLPPGVPLWFPRYPWGSADWTRAEAAAQPTVSGLKPLFWQFTSQPYDRNIAYLPEAALRAWAQGDTTTEEEHNVAMDKDDVETLATTDGVFLAPKDAKDYSDNAKDPNHYWSFGSHVNDNTTRIRRVDKAVAALTAQLAALTATVAAIAKGGGLTPAEIQAAAEAGARAALAQLGDKLQED
ncbi:glycoside hydrolase family 25 protein [Streptomyces sp. NPDC004237]|uniref:glycoside hydrolase family 25 protein n=1 Tax=Streptomyces sp. NPDC004237 TaxID=3154455 RepID=UPI0033B73772